MQIGIKITYIFPVTGTDFCFAAVTSPTHMFPPEMLAIRDQRKVAATQVRTQQVATMATQHMQRKQLSCHRQPCEPDCYQQLICLPSFVITNCNRLRAKCVAYLVALVFTYLRSLPQLLSSVNRTQKKQQDILLFLFFTFD